MISIMSTIRGENVRLVRPTPPTRCNIYKDERPVIGYNKRPKTIKENSGKVVAVCVKLVSGGIRSISVPATHLDVIEALVIDPDLVEAIGWQLENGNYLWSK